MFRTVFQCVKDILYTGGSSGHMSWSHSARYFSQETFKLFKCPIFIFVVLFAASYLKISGSLRVVVLRKHEASNKMAKQHDYIVFIEIYLSQSGFNSRIFSYQLLLRRHAGLRRNQHLFYLLMPLSPREEGENTEPLISNICLLGQSSPRIFKSSHLSL